MPQQPGQRIARGRAALEHLLDQREHCILVEVVPEQVSLLPGPDLELTGLQRLLDVDP